MAREGNEYRFFTVWDFENTRIEDVSDILEDVGSLARWWPSVYLEVNVVEPGGMHAVGLVADLFTKGWLPYTLRWRLRVVEQRYPSGSTLKASGDFEGTGVWVMEQRGSVAHVTYDWRILAEKPLLKYLTPILRPLFSANHRWAMARGQESMRLELQRRAATSDAERAAIPAAPPPTFQKQRRP